MNYYFSEELIEFNFRFNYIDFWEKSAMKAINFVLLLNFRESFYNFHVTHSSSWNEMITFDKLYKYR